MKKTYEKPEVFSEGAFETLGDSSCTWLTTGDGGCDPINGGILLEMPST
jgi:hypothetical protein